MRYLIFLIALLAALAPPALATDITIGAVQVPNFNRSDIGSDISVSSISATNGSTSLTCSNCFPSSVVGLAGWRITVNSIDYTVAECDSRSAVTLTSNFQSSTSTYSGTVRKFIFLRVYLSGPAFTPLGSVVPIQPGALGSQNWYKRVAASVQNDGSTNILYLPEFELPATTDGSPATARWQAGLYTQSGAFIQNFPGCTSTWRLNAADDPTSWTGICSFNVTNPPPPVSGTDYYIKNEIDSFLPSCSANDLIYSASSGRVRECLVLSADFTITLGTLYGSGFVNRIQEEGSNLTQRQILNFVGSSATAADDPGNSRTNVTFASPLNALASNSTAGFWAPTGAVTGNARTLQQPAAGITITNPAGIVGDPTFGLANDLAGLEGLGGTGIPARTATDTWAVRTLQQPAAGITITNPAGIAGDPTFALANDLAALEGLGSTGIPARTATDTWAVRTLQAPAAGFTITNPAGVAGDPTFVLADDLAAVEGLATTGLAARTGTSTWATRTLQQPAAGITITNADGVSGDPTFALANDLAGLEGLSTTGVAVRTGTSTWTTRTITGTANQITVSNGDGVSGNPTLSTPQDIATSSSPTFANLTLGTGGSGALRTTTGSGDTLLLQARDVDGGAYTTFLTLKANNNPSLQLDQRMEGTPGSGSNAAGSNIVIGPGAGTGTGTPGVIAFTYPLIGASGSTVQSFSSNAFTPWVNVGVVSSTQTTVANTTTETDIMGTVDAGSKTIEAGLGRTSRVFRLHLAGIMNDTGTPTLRFRLKLGSTTISDTTAVTLVTITGGGCTWEIDTIFSVLSVGGSGSVRVHKFSFTYDISNASTRYHIGNASSTTTVDTTTSQQIVLTVEWGTANASNTITRDITLVDMAR